MQAVGRLHILLGMMFEAATRTQMEQLFLPQPSDVRLPPTDTRTPVRTHAPL